MKYTVDYFIEKFSSIPEDKWKTGDFGRNGVHCAMGHLGETEDERDKMLPESLALAKIIDPDESKDPFFVIADINDSAGEKYGEHPKERILNRLTEIKFQQLADAEGN